MTVLDERIVNGPAGYSGVDGDEEWAAEVRRLADLRGATLLAHNYQLPAIQDVADHVGDSLALSRIAESGPGAWLYLTANRRHRDRTSESADRCRPIPDHARGPDGTDS